MGNTTNREQWAGRERLAFIERTAWWRGAVNRRDLQEVFGISAAQASADLQAYLELNPGALAYNLRAKRYEARPEMGWVLGEPRLEEAIRVFLGGGGTSWSGGGSPDGRVAMVETPVRKAGASVERRVFLAVEGGRWLRVKYWSVNQGRSRWREIGPHAFGHDGYRWHVRAWCVENGDFRDFVLSRITEADWPGAVLTLPQRDDGWEQWEEVVVRANSHLSTEQQAAIERDYGMHGGSLKLRVRRALAPYLRAHLRLATGQSLPAHLEEVAPAKQRASSKVTRGR